MLIIGAFNLGAAYALKRHKAGRGKKWTPQRAAQLGKDVEETKAQSKKKMTDLRACELLTKNNPAYRSISPHTLRRRLPAEKR
jgi:hypothetical protein